MSLDAGGGGTAIETLERTMAGLPRIHAHYRLGAARSLLTLARAIRADDGDGLVGVREAAGRC